MRVRERLVKVLQFLRAPACTKIEGPDFPSQWDGERIHIQWRYVYGVSGALFQKSKDPDRVDAWMLTIQHKFAWQSEARSSFCHYVH